MNEVKEVEYEEWECQGNDDAVCPYCGYKNDIVLDDGDSEGDVNETECGECEKTFWYSFSVSVTFDTMPSENHYIRQSETLARRINSLERVSQEYSWQEEQLLRLRQRKDALDRKIQEVLQEGKEQ